MVDCSIGAENIKTGDTCHTKIPKRDFAIKRHACMHGGGRSQPGGRERCSESGTVNATTDNRYSLAIAFADSEEHVPGIDKA